MKKAENMTYAGTGVSYEEMDPFKRLAQLAGRRTAGNISRLSGGEFREFEPSRGESAYLIEAAKSFFAFVEEGLGTKNLVADAMYKLTGRSFYENIAQDTVAMIVNDMITVGALPLSVAMHLAVGSSDWFQDEKRAKDLIHGWKRACDMAGCTWGGGETPTLKGVVVPGTVVLSGSSFGLVKPKANLIDPKNIRPNDAIVLVGGSGIHANGLTLARSIAEKLSTDKEKMDGYLAKLSDGRTYGEALLDPTPIYVSLVELMQQREIGIHYAMNITGHGWRKIMRATTPYSYVIDSIPKPQPVFDFIQKHGPVSDEEAYGNLNMNAGFAVIVSDFDAPRIGELYADYALPIMVAGHVERGPKRVVIEPKGLEYAGETLAVR
jgi:phosphoribosylformylglycinamidine cyclo-ligase